MKPNPLDPKKSSGFLLWSIESFMLRKAIVCSYRMYALPNDKQALILSQVHHRARKYKIQPDMHCPDWEFYVFDAKGRMKAYRIQEWMPRKTNLCQRLKAWLQKVTR